MPSDDVLITEPTGAAALYVLAHGAGAGMRHPFLHMMSDLLAERNIGTYRYEFPYMRAKKRRPDSPPVAVASVREAVEAAGRGAAKLPLVAGGKSFGGRMTSTAASEAPLPGVHGCRARTAVGDLHGAVEFRAEEPVPILTGPALGHPVGSHGQSVAPEACRPH